MPNTHTTHTFSEKESTIRLIHDFCISKKISLSLAESCTGGYISSQLTGLPGCSQYFLGSIIAYSNSMKKSVLGIDDKLLKEHGAVSGPVVSEMAKNVLKLTGSSYSLAISGIAGPSGAGRDKPVGTIWAAIANSGDTYIWNFHLLGNRQQIIEKSSQIVLDQLWMLLKTEK